MVLLGPTAFVLTPILVAQALYGASDAPTLVSALATSAFNIGNAGGSWLGGLALSTSLGLRGPRTDRTCPHAGLDGAAYPARRRTSLGTLGTPEAEP